MSYKEPTILFREDRDNRREAEIAKEYFPIEKQRANCYDSLIVGRYSVLPYYKELWTDLVINSCVLVNSPEQHNWIANFDYYLDLSQFTPDSWDDHTFKDADWDGPFVVKGTTNSKKFEWNTMMYAEDKRQAASAS